jgi:dipeptidase D
MINLDSEESDLVSYGCAGCSILEYLYSLETTEVNNSYKTYEITISNLLGGHSGAYIHELRGNANIMLSDLISEIANKVNIQLISFNSVDPILNVISQTSTCKIAFNENQFNEVQNIINSRKNYLLEHYQAEKNAKFTINSSSHESNALALTDSSLNKFLTLNTILPNGSVETFNIKYNVYNVSSNFYNIALNNGDVRNSMSIRFIRSSHLDYLLNKINTIYSHILGKGNYKIIDTGFKMDP